MAVAVQSRRRVPDTLLEATSGHPDVADYARTGVDFAVGSLTHSAPALDLARLH